MLPRRRHKDLVIENLADETLVYDLKRHKGHCLNGTASRVWKLCNGRTTVPEMMARLERDLHMPVDEQVVWFALRRLDKAYLLRERLPSGLSERALSRRQLMRR